MNMETLHRPVVQSGPRVRTTISDQMMKVPAHMPSARSGVVDVLCFLAPALFFKATNVLPIFATGVLRILSTHLMLALHYLYFDKENYETKIQQSQLEREKADYLVGIILHMWAQLVLQLMFPGMFFGCGAARISGCFVNTFLVHVILVEPLYYAVHRWLHVPAHMKSMHGFHHLSSSTVPSTSLVQNFNEHFIYIATFGPAMIFPYFLCGYQHWSAIMFYLLWFDAVNAYGHTNIRCRHFIWDCKWLPFRYLFYTPEFHLGHHAYYNKNFALFMPIWDHVFATFREYRKPDKDLLPAKKQDFVFIGHNGGLGHFLTIPEVSFYNLYDRYRSTGMPIEMELMAMNCIMIVSRLFMRYYKVSRYLVDRKYIGRVICLMRSPLDFTRKSNYLKINKEIVTLIEEQHREFGTRFFGLGNLTKMKQLNDGGVDVVRMVESHPYLRDKKIRLWTGDTMTAASVFNQLAAIPNLDKIFYIGANGKIGHAVCKLLAEKGVKIRIFSKNPSIESPNITYTQDLNDILSYQYVVIGKQLKASMYSKVKWDARVIPNQLLMDYTVPFTQLPIPRDIRHIQIGVLKVQGNDFLRGYYDICFGVDQGMIYPCHAGCIINMITGRETNEVGEINVDDMAVLWKKASELGLSNLSLPIFQKDLLVTA
jgi:sterol desaturase/sphingolipid hydroxylase (fatty acid hydroxylase superfamily)